MGEMADNKKIKKIVFCGLLLAAALTSFIAGDGLERVNLFDRKFDTDGPVGVHLPEKASYGKTATVQDRTVQVYVTGEVRNPGIYTLAFQSRGLAAVAKAGGFTEQADRERVNLTRILRDGAHLNVPALRKNQEPKQYLIGVDRQAVQRSFRRPSAYSTDKSRTAQGYVKPSLLQGLPVCVNTASVEELQILPGVHSELARRIVNWRSGQKFLSVEELLQVRGMNRKILEGLRNFIGL